MVHRGAAGGAVCSQAVAPLGLLQLQEREAGEEGPALGVEMIVFERSV